MINNILNRSSANTTTPEFASDLYGPCPMGYYCPEGTDEPKGCDPGYFR